MRGNKMGPEEKGPKTGRGLGLCNGNDKPGYMGNDAPQGRNRRAGMGRGRGFDRGCGFRREGGRWGNRDFGIRDSVNFEKTKLAARIEELEKVITELKK